MKKTILFLVFLPIAAASQKKEPLLTIKAGEEFDSDHSKIIPTAAGANWEIVTVNYESKKYLMYSKTVKGKSVPVDLRPGNFITSGMEDGKEFFRVNSTGTKYGPYDGINPWYDEDKKILYGYSYAKDGMSYYVDLINNKNYGPFYKGGVWFVDDRNLVYTNTVKNASTQKGEVFLFENDKKFGPYESATYKRCQTPDMAPLINWKENGKQYTNAPQCKGIAFEGLANAIEIKDGWLIEGWEKKYGERMLYLPDGSKLEYNDKVKHLTNSQGEYIRADLVAGSGSYAAYKLTYKGKDLGIYAVKKWNREELKLTDFFDHHFMKVDINGNWSNAFTNDNYVYSPSKGLLGPFSESEMSRFFFTKDGYAIIKADSSLEINGKKIMDKIVWADVKEYPATWWAFQKRGDYVYPFKNGTEVKREDLPEKLKHLCTYDDDLVKVRRGSEFFMRQKGTDKLLGPVGQYDNACVLTPDKKYFAFERGEDNYVVINGKTIAKGFHIVYNEKLKSFHWFMMEGQKISLYTYTVK